MKLKKLALPLFVSLTFIAASCSLDIEGTDSVISDTGDGGFNGVEDVESSVNGLYNDIRGHLEGQDNNYALRTVTTDELLIPTRGTDWGDNGIWRTLHAHTWTSAHQYVETAWNQFNQNIFRAGEIIDERSTNNRTAQRVAEAKFLRAFSMFMIVDFYGQVPFRNPGEGADVNPTVLTRSEAFDFIIRDLEEARPDLPATGPGAETERASQASVDYLLAKALLNKFIYKGEAAPAQGDLQGVIDAVDRIDGAGFGLVEGYFEIFEETPDAETIWWTPTSVGNNIWNGLHYHQIVPDQTGGGWNGFSTLAEFYDLFEGPADNNAAGAGQEERRGWVPDGTNSDATNHGIGYGFLLGQQWGAAEGFDDGGAPIGGYTALNDRAGNPLVFTREFPGLIGNSERNGIRVIKYHPANGPFAGHKIAFRYADAYLMRAEARLRLGQDITGEVNTLRTLRGAAELGSVDAQALLDERGRELYIEGWRRNDMVRFGTFLRDWEFKEPAEVGNEARLLFPIPSNALLSNPNLQQNPGY